ncbi:MAG: DoxX family protein [Terracidiphilus sp.]
MSSETLGNTSSVRIERRGEGEPLLATNQSDSSKQSTARSSSVSKWRLWTGRGLTALVVLFMLFDAVGKLFMPPFVVEAFARLGFPANLGVSIGVLLLACTIIYAIPRTAVLGAILLTGFLGGAVAIQMRAGSPLFETIFPVIFGVIVWAGIYLRDERLCGVFPFRRMRRVG